jgi:hypothetical protein
VLVLADVARAYDAPKLRFRPCYGVLGKVHTATLARPSCLYRAIDLLL